MAELSITNITSNSFEARLTGIKTTYNDRTIEWILDGERVELMPIDDGSSRSDWKTFDGLDPNTEYNIEAIVWAYDSDSNEDIELGYAYDWIVTEADSGGTYVPDVESIYIQEMTADNPSTEIKVQAKGFDTKYFEADWELTWYICDPSLSGATLIDTISDEVPAGGSSSSIITFDGLSPETIYEIELRVRYYVDGDRNTEWFYETFSTKSESSSSNRPDEFKWNDGTKEKYSGKPFDITAEEWGNLLDNINAVREYKEYPEIETTTTPNSGIVKFYYPKPNDTFYATNYNQCLYAFYTMEIITDTQYAEYAVKPGDPITADAINFLVETINSVE